MKNSFAYLGPKGTFTEAAFLQMPIAQGADLIPAESVRDALNLVRTGKVFGALVPIENSVEGVVARTLDELAIGDPLVISEETTLPVTFSLMVLAGNKGKKINSVATHPHAEAQCRAYIAKEMPGVEVITTSSTAASAEGLTTGNYDINYTHTDNIGCTTKSTKTIRVI